MNINKYKIRGKFQANKGNVEILDPVTSTLMKGDVATDEDVDVTTMDFWSTSAGFHGNVGQYFQVNLGHIINPILGDKNTNGGTPSGKDDFECEISLVKEWIQQTQKVVPRITLLKIHSKEIELKENELDNLREVIFPGRFPFKYTTDPQ